MISVKVEKELKGENKIIAWFTFRQAICAGLVLVILALYYFLMKPTTDMLVPVALILGALAWYIGWHEKNGMHTEYFIFKKIKENILMNTNRKYRTKNQYISLFNEAYKSDRDKDLLDKKKKHIVKNRTKKAARKIKKSKLKAYL